MYKIPKFPDPIIYTKNHGIKCSKPKAPTPEIFEMNCKLNKGDLINIFGPILSIFMTILGLLILTGTILEIYGIKL